MRQRDDAGASLCTHGPRTAHPPGDELERRFKAGEAVYEEDMVHRPPGVSGGGGGGGALADVEGGFTPASSWLSDEVRLRPSGGAPRRACRPHHLCADMHVMHVIRVRARTCMKLGRPCHAPQAGAAGAAASFTRVVVGDLKPDVLAALADEDAALGVLRDLAHLYHYYTHGPKGNAFM